MDEQMTGADVVLEVEATSPRRSRRARGVAGVAAATVVVAGVVGVVLSSRGSDEDQGRAVETEDASSEAVPSTTASTVAVAADPSTTEVATDSLVAAPPATTAPRPKAPAVVSSDGEATTTVDEPTTTTTVAPRFRVVPGPPLPVGSPMTAFVAGEVRLGPGGKTFGPLGVMQPGDTLDMVSPDFVATMTPGGGSLCGYMGPITGLAPAEGFPVYGADGATVVAHLVVGTGCVPVEPAETTS